MTPLAVQAYSQARAASHSRSTVAAEPIASPTSSIERPAKNFSSTRRPRSGIEGGESRQRLVQRQHIDVRRRRHARRSSRVTRTQHRSAWPSFPPARDRRGCGASIAPRRRRTGPGSASRVRCSTSRRYASCTSAVGCNVWSGRSCRRYRPRGGATRHTPPGADPRGRHDRPGSTRGAIASHVWEGRTRHAPGLVLAL